MGSNQSDSDSDSVTKELHPDEITTLTVNDSGQAYFGTDLAGCELTVAYEVEHRPTEETTAGISDSVGSGTHRYILQQCETALNRVGASFHITQSTATESPDAIADFAHLPSPGEASSIEEGKMSAYAYETGLPMDQPLYIEVETSTVTKPTRILSNIANAVNEGAVCLFACQRSTTGSTNAGEAIERILYQYDSDSNNYEPLEHPAIKNRCRDSPQIGDRYSELYQKPSHLKTDEGHPIVVDKTDANEITWIKNGDRVIGRNQNGEEVLFFDYYPALPPSGDAAKYGQYTGESWEANVLYREYTGERWEVKRGYGEDAKVVDTYNVKPALQQDYRDVHEPFIPEQEFDRLPTSDDFVIILFPADDSDNTIPVILEQGETRPLF